MEVWVAKKNDILKINSEEKSVGQVGQKALGLCHVPKAWTLPFFVISKEMFLEICRNPNKKEEIVELYLPNIIKAIRDLYLGDKVIIRSSGEKEGMVERGRYESLVCDISEIGKKLVSLVDCLSQHQELSESGIPFVVQRYAGDTIVGHVSNERRFSKENRDFVFEFCRKGMPIETGHISLRNWRKKYDLENHKKTNLKIDEGIRNALNLVCAYCYYNKIRTHIEFVCSNERFYIVQSDKEVPNSITTNPEVYEITMFDNEEEFKPQILRKICDKDKGKYRKIDNVFVYKEVGIEVPPLYILDDTECIGALKNGQITDELMNDLIFMTKQSLVIRTNIMSKEKLKSQLSLRSHELREWSQAVKFLIDAPQKLQKECIDDYIFIFHNFIPAKIAAFVNAKPLERIVEIQALWGLPEGLYYNAHDRISVDTKAIDLSKMRKSKFSVSKNEAYKESFIAPDENGTWVVKKLGAPYDWKCTIEDKEVLCDMAYKARKISEKVGRELSIMWFVDIDKDFYKADNIPWYHEEYDRNNYYTAGKTNVNTQYRKKYFYEQEIVIETRTDLDTLQKMQPRDIGLVRIQPKEDNILRSREFIKEVGELCKQKGANVFLEGAVLAHSFYQLVETGVTVLVAHEVRQYEERIEYNKLVRDRIPQIIRDNGENVSCAVIKGSGLIHEIKNKIIEESYEVMAADEKEDIIEELADLEEICTAFEKHLDLVVCDRYLVRGVRHQGGRNVLFDAAVIEDSKQKGTGKLGDHFFTTMKRNGSVIQVDFLFGRTDKNSNVGYPLCYESETSKTILKNAFQLLFMSEVEECKQTLKNIRDASLQMQKDNNYSEYEFEEIRRKKKEKRGGFDKGYVLFQTDFLRSDNTFWSEELTEQESEPIDIYDLPLKARIDIDNLSSGQLLIRMTFPIYIRQTEWIIRNEKLKNYFEKETEIKITRNFQGTEIHFNVEVMETNYNQLNLFDLYDASMIL